MAEIQGFDKNKILETGNRVSIRNCKNKKSLSSTIWEEDPKIPNCRRITLHCILNSNDASMQPNQNLKAVQYQ